MAETTTSLYDKQKAALLDLSKRPDEGLHGGRLHCFRAQVTLSGSEAANDTIRLRHLPKGFRPVAHLSKIVPSGDPGTTLSVDIGTDGDPNAFADTVVLSTGAAAAFDAGTAPVINNADRRIGDSDLGDDPTLLLTVHAANTLTANTKLDIFIVGYLLT